MSLFRKIGRIAARGIRGIARVPGIRSVPVLGLGVSAAAGALTVAEAVRGRRPSSTLPALPPPGGLPMLPGRASVPMLPGMPGSPPMQGQRSIFRNDPNVIEALKPYAIPERGLRQYYRAPKGFVVMYDSAGDPYGIPKQIARSFLGWKPAKRPPISVGDWESVKRADRTVRKVKKVMTKMSYVDRNVSGGKVRTKKTKKRSC